VLPALLPLRQGLPVSSLYPFCLSRNQPHFLPQLLPVKKLNPACEGDAGQGATQKDRMGKVNNLDK